MKYTTELLLKNVEKLKTSTENTFKKYFCLILVLNTDNIKCFVIRFKFQPLKTRY